MILPLPILLFTLRHDLGSIPSEDPYEEAARQLLEQAHILELGVGWREFAAAARQPGPTMAHRVDHSHVDNYGRPDVRSRESFEFYTRHHDAQTDRAAVRAEIEVLRRERLAYEQEILETDVRRHEWQRQAADDLDVQYIMRTQALEAGACVDTLEDTGSSS
ncbi:hypothetical protein Tco_0925225 [Tanacetum coccineum]|uniref:Uncharacterized protein n=1 Tax=Tanacetum coccineum TaxID=301880 RepID=A0ABQ5D689_9ASTR